jgi:hypothetical protein
MDGIDLAILLKTQYPSCRILLFSGQAVTSDLLEMAAKKGHTSRCWLNRCTHDLFERALARLTTPSEETKDGSSVWVRNSVTAFDENASRPRHLVHICEDITDESV